MMHAGIFPDGSIHSRLLKMNDAPSSTIPEESGFIKVTKLWGSPPGLLAKKLRIWPGAGLFCWEKLRLLNFNI